MVWKLSRAGELVSPFNNTPFTARKGLESIYLVRHRGNHFNSVVFKNQKFPLNQSKGFYLKSWIREARGSSGGSSSNYSLKNAPLHLPETENLCIATSSPFLKNTSSEVQTDEGKAIERNDGIVDTIRIGDGEMGNR